MSTAMWKLEKDLCRCCHAEGSFKNLAEPCFQLGQEEIYFDMLQECLDIKILPMTGELGELTYTICESCVSRLRDASNFKRQVQDCEERFKDMYSRNLIKALNVKEEPMVSDNEELKQEFHSMDDDDDAFVKFDDDDDDLEDSQSLSELEKIKGKGKAKPKPKPKLKQPVKKGKTKKNIKEEETEVTQAAVSGEKKKGSKPKTEIAQYCDVTENEDRTLKYSCAVCTHAFKQYGHFLQHYNQVHLKRRKATHPCVICKAQLVPRHRWKHMEEHHGWPAPTCGACGKKFSYPHQVTRHQKQFHMGEKPHKCNECEMSFGSKMSLRLHSHKHSDIREFSCEYCSKAFKTLKYLRLHTKIHLNDKRYVCSVCQEAFVQSGSLKYHIAKRHPELL